LNRELTARRRDGQADRRTIASPTELIAVIAEEFGIDLPATTRFPSELLDWSA